MARNSCGTGLLGAVLVVLGRKHQVLSPSEGLSQKSRVALGQGFWDSEEDEDPRNNLLVRLVARHLPLHDRYSEADGSKGI